MNKVFLLNRTQVQQVKHGLKLLEKEIAELYEFEAIEWQIEYEDVKALLYNTLGTDDAVSYYFENFQIRLINTGLRLYLSQLSSDFNDLSTVNLPEKQIEALYDRQQDLFILLSDFRFYSKDR